MALVEGTISGRAEKFGGLPTGSPLLDHPAFATAGPPRAPGLRTSLGIALEQRRLFVLLPFAAIFGLAAYLLPSSEPHPLAMGAVAVTLVVLLFLSRHHIVPLRIVGVLACFWIGFCLLPMHGAMSGTPMLRGTVYGQFRVTVDQVLSRSPEAMRVLVSGIVPMAGAEPIEIRRARLFLRQSAELAPGDTLEAAIRFYAVPGPVLPGGFDAQFNGYFDGIGAYGTVTGAILTVRPAENPGLARGIEAIRGGIAQRVDQHLSAPSAGIARAIINGDQSAVPEQARELMATAGLAHVLSISGLHLTLVAGGVFATLRLALSVMPGLAQRLAIKPAAATGGIVAALAYYAISGGNVAATRSTIMIVLVFGAIIFGRRALTMRNVAIAALLVLALDPVSVFGPSFQLSFAAVAGLVGAFELGRRADPAPARGPLGHAWRYFFGLAGTSLVAGTATLLFSAYHFQQTSPLGVLGNLVSLPLVGFVTMPAGLMAVLAMPFGLEGPFLSAMGWSLDRMLDLAGFVAHLSGGLGGRPLLTPLALVIGLLALCWFAFVSTRWRLLGPALALPAVLLLALDRAPDVLVSDSTGALALREAGGLTLVAGQSDSFAVGVWRETYGDGFGASESVRCDSIACLANGDKGFTLALVKDVAGFFEECAAVDLVLTRGLAPSSCKAATTVIDYQDLRTGGVHWLSWDPVQRSFEIRPAITNLRRVWRIQPR